MSLVIHGGQVYDPSSGWDGEIRDIYIQDGRIVPHLDTVDQVIPAAGRMVMAGGIDCRGQVATYGLDLLRLRGVAPSAGAVGRCYASLGYTHVHEPFLTPLTAGHVHRELASLPLVDTSASLVLNLRDLDLALKSPERRPEVLHTIQFFLDKTGSLGLRVVEPFVRYRQDYLTHRHIQSETMLGILAELAHSLGMVITLEASPALLMQELPEGVFHLGGLGPALQSEELGEAAWQHLERGITGDMGLMAPQTDPSPDSLTVHIDQGWFRPLDLTPTVPPGAARRALKLALQYQGPGLAFSGAGSYLAPVTEYGRFLGWLGDDASRPGDWTPDLPEREFSLSEWVWATRHLPAQILGLHDQGRLAPGARADVALFEADAVPPPGGRPRIRPVCHTLIKAGEKIIDNYQLVAPQAPKAMFHRRFDVAPPALAMEICQYRSFRPETLWPAPDSQWQEVRE